MTVHGFSILAMHTCTPLIYTYTYTTNIIYQTLHPAQMDQARLKQCFAFARLRHISKGPNQCFGSHGSEPNLHDTGVILTATQDYICVTLLWQFLHGRRRSDSDEFFRWALPKKWLGSFGKSDLALLEKVIGLFFKKWLALLEKVIWLFWKKWFWLFWKKWLALF